MKVFHILRIFQLFSCFLLPVSGDYNSDPEEYNAFATMLEAMSVMENGMSDLSVEQGLVQPRKITRISPQCNLNTVFINCRIFYI